MSALKDVLESNEFIKSGSLIFIMMPFWYISIYLFNKNFIDRSDYIAISCFCYGLSVVSVYSSAFSILVSDIRLGKRRRLFLLIGPELIKHTIFLSVLIFIFYSIRYIYNWKIDYYVFMLCFFTPVSLINIHNITKRN
ncbi:hypothetical protein CMV04_12485 [Elizabethkingia anophelis]|nr:hypothetical protein [Elizabethkingia anophelis]